MMHFSFDIHMLPDNAPMRKKKMFFFKFSGATKSVRIQNSQQVRNLIVTKVSKIEMRGFIIHYNE